MENKKVSGESDRQTNKRNLFQRGIITIVIGFVFSIILALFFGGYSFWLFPGLLVISLGVADVLNKVYFIAKGKKSKDLWIGMTVFFIGFSGYLSVMTHVMLALIQTITMLVMIIGFIVIVKALISSSNHKE